MEHATANIIAKRTEALDFIRLDAVAEAADLVAEFAGAVATAAERGEKPRVSMYAALMGRAVKSTFEIIAQLGQEQVLS